MDAMQPLLTARETAVILGIPRMDVYRLKDKPDGLRACRVGSALRFRREDVAAYKLRTDRREGAL